MEGSTVYVINKEQDKRTMRFAGRAYVLPPNEKTPVPFEAAALWFGDPRAAQDIAAVRDEDSDVVTWVPDRDSELRRLTVRYGGDDNARFPDIEIQDLDGNVMHTPIDDPEGEHVFPVVTTLTENQRKDQRIAALEDKLDRLMSMLGGDTGKVTDPLTDEPVSDESLHADPPSSSPEGLPDADEPPKPKGRPVK